MHDTSVKILSFAHTALFRLTGGIIGSRLVNNDMLLLTTTGRATGESHTVPLLYLRDGADLIVIASYGGRTHHPDWYQNLLHDPTASIQIDSHRTTVDAATISPDERQEWWPRIVEAYSDYEVYQSRTDREIPVVRLSASG
jgi:deazaflavin-dependent oxidoreductase (nitroreductase family)